jgi:uncharacterized membrane protein YphA (DoxX/SURF4 family)
MNAIERWLVAPQPIWRLVLLRLLVPLVILAFLSSRLIHADYWLSPRGFQVPDLGGSDWRQPLYLPSIAPWAAWTVATATVVSGLMLAAGWLTRVAGALFALVLAYLALADRLEAFTVSKLAPVLVLALIYGPSGARCGIDAWRRRRRDPDAPRPTVDTSGALRFFQLFLVVMYSGSGIAKLRGDWLTGSVLWSHVHDDYQTAVSYFLVRRLPGGAWHGLQWLTLTFEVGAPLWFALRPTRTPALVAGLVMHAMIGLMFGPVVWFALLMSSLLVACYAPLSRRTGVDGESPSCRPAHQAQPAKVGGDGRPERRAHRVAHAELFAHLADDWRNPGIVHMADMRKQVVFDLEVESPHVPGEETVGGREIDRGLDLVHRPLGGDPPR